MAAYSGVPRLPVAAFVCFAGGLCLGQTSQYVATTIAGGGLPATPATAVGTPVALPAFGSGGFVGEPVFYGNELCFPGGSRRHRDARGRKFGEPRVLRRWRAGHQRPVQQSAGPCDRWRRQSLRRGLG